MFFLSQPNVIFVPWTLPYESKGYDYQEVIVSSSPWYGSIKAPEKNREGGGEYVCVLGKTSGHFCGNVYNSRE